MIKSSAILRGRPGNARYIVPAVIVAFIAIFVAGLVGNHGVSAAAGEVGIYTGAEVVPGPGEEDSAPVELGLRFQVGQSGAITAIRFYKNSGNTGTHTGTLWADDGTKLATVTFAKESAVGWQTAALSKQVPISPGRNYVVSYHTSVGYYAQQTDVFTGGATIGNSAIWGTAGVFQYGEDSGFPADTWRGAAYFVDALFLPGSGSTGTSGTSATSQPSGTSSSATPTPTRSTSASGSTRPPASGASTGMYTGDESGDEVDDPNSVELGVRFQVAQAGYISAIRYYKTPGNTGSHTGSLWGPDGTRLANVTFAGETSRGWQTAALSPPVAVSPGQSYVASYYASAGHYAEEIGTFAGDATIGNTTIWGTAGVFRYGSSSAFPTSTWSDASYYVDAIFAPTSATSTTPTSTPRPTSSGNSSSTGEPSSTPTPTPTRTPTPTPTQSTGSSGSSGNPPANTAGFPDSSNTGPTSSTLRSVPDQVTSGQGWHYDARGWVQIDTDGAVFSGFRTALNIDVQASNVTISNNSIQVSAGGWGISLRHTENVTIDQNEIYGPSATNNCSDGIRDIYGDSDSVTITRNDISYCQSGINHFNQGGVIRDNYIWGIGQGSCSGGNVDCGHWNGIQLGAGAGPLMIIDHNTILNPSTGTDALMLANDDGPQANRTITNNLLGGGGYTFYGAGGASVAPKNIVFTGNQFTTRYFPNSGSFGPVAHWQAGTGNVWSNNTWADGPRAGQPVNPA